MLTFEVLCVTMHQTDFSKIKTMNLHSNVVFANQCDRTAYEQLDFDGHYGKMISTQTRGVGINRNFALAHASADICLFADDDVRYKNDLEQIVLSEFEAHPDADIIIFHLDTNGARKQRQYPKTRKHGRWEPMPWGGVRIAIRLRTIKKANIWFTTLFGGGCVFPSGEDSMWLLDAKRKGLTFYVSSQTIGTVSFEESSWFTGYDEKFFYGKGAFYAAVHPKTAFLWKLYFALRTHKLCALPFSAKMRWMRHGQKGYENSLKFEEYLP